MHIQSQSCQTAEEPRAISSILLFREVAILIYILWMFSGTALVLPLCEGKTWKLSWFNELKDFYKSKVYFGKFPTVRISLRNIKKGKKMGLSSKINLLYLKDMLLALKKTQQWPAGTLYNINAGPNGTINIHGSSSTSQTDHGLGESFSRQRISFFFIANKATNLEGRNDTSMILEHF